MAVFAMVFGHAFGVSPLIVNNAWIAAENPYWHFLGLSFSPCGAAVRALCAHPPPPEGMPSVPDTRYKCLT